MKLRKVRVQNFRSIVDSGVVSIEEVVTVLIGKNEQGKTNFLKALASFNESNSYEPGDFPKHLRPSLEDKDRATIPTVTLWVTAEPSEKPLLSKVIGHDDSIVEVKSIRFFDGHYDYFTVGPNGEEAEMVFSPPDIAQFVESIKNDADALRAKFKSHAQRTPQFAPTLGQAEKHIDTLVNADFAESGTVQNVINTFSTALKGLPGQDKPIQDDVEATIKSLQIANQSIKQALETGSSSTLKEHLPHFVLHSITLDKVPNEVPIAQFINNQERVSKGMANLCAVAGLSTQKIQELASSSDTSHRESYEDHYRASISGGLNEFWTQETYNVHFRIDKDKLSVSISDSTYSPRIQPSERSDGFQWYLSFYGAVLNGPDRASTVLLLDNPAIELHADGQRDIKRFLEEKQPSNTQVIYVTHSPAMIDPFYLEQVRKVELEGDEVGTKVSSKLFPSGSDEDLLEPVRSAIGASLVTSLLFGDYNILVEGAADKPILEGAFELEHSGEKVFVNGSVSETKEGFLPRFYQRSGLPLVIFVDADSGGRELVKALGTWGIPETKIVQLKEIFSEKEGDFELEDVFSEEFYHKAVSNAYPDKPVDAPGASTGKRTKRYEAKYKETYDIGFNKRRVAESVKKLLLDGKADAESANALREITTKILERCKGQATKAQT